jgi:hypothetical protein
MANEVKIAEWPLIYTSDDGTLTITRVSMQLDKSVGVGTRAAAAPPSYADPPSYDSTTRDGFRATFEVRKTGEWYGCKFADGDVSALCPPDVTLSASSFAELIADGAPEISIQHDRVVASWKLQVVRRIEVVSFEMTRMKGVKGTEILEIRLQVQASRTANLEDQVASLKTALLRVAVLEAQIAELKTSVARMCNIMIDSIQGTAGSLTCVRQLTQCNSELLNP